MLTVHKEIRMRIYREYFSLKERALVEQECREEEIILGLKKSSLDIVRIERLYAQAEQDVTKHWEEQYPRLVDEFEKVGVASVYDYGKDGQKMLRVFHFQEMGYQYFNDIPKTRSIIENWYGEFDRFNPRNLPLPDGEVNVDLARRYVEFQKYRRSLTSRWARTGEFFRAWMEAFLRQKFVRPFPAYFSRKVTAVINGREYIYKLTGRNQEWFDINLVISGLDPVERFSFHRRVDV